MLFNLPATTSLVALVLLLLLSTTIPTTSARPTLNIKRRQTTTTTTIPATIVDLDIVTQHQQPTSLDRPDALLPLPSFALDLSLEKRADDDDDDDDEDCEEYEYDDDDDEDEEDVTKDDNDKNDAGPIFAVGPTGGALDPTSPLQRLKYGGIRGVHWRLATDLQAIATSLLGQFYETATNGVPTRLAAATATATGTALDQVKFGAERGVGWRLATDVQPIVVSLLEGFYETASVGGEGGMPSRLVGATDTPPVFLGPTGTTVGATLAPRQGIDRFNLKKAFTSLSAFTSNIKLTTWAWGQHNVDVVQSIPEGSYADGVSTDSIGSALKVAYPAGSYSPSHLPVGGFGFYENSLDVTAATNLSFAFSVFFPTEFDFVKGGKLPGLYGGKRACSGGSTAENCFSTRIMWRKGGIGELYLYAPREKQVNSLCTLAPLSFCNSVYGMSIGRGSWTFLKGQWNTIRQDVWLNTPGVADGGFNIWHNGNLVLTSNTVYYRNSALGGLANGTTVDPIPLIDYDSLPDSVVIPNGGLVAPPPTATVSTSSASETEYTFAPTLVTKIVGTGTKTSVVVETTSVLDYPTDWEVRKKRRSVNLTAPVPPPPAPTPHFSSPGAYEVDDSPSSSSNNTILDKRAGSPLLIGFLGIKADSFFGGSEATWAPKSTLYAYFSQMNLRIRSTVA